MNIRILVATALALAILVPAANAASDDRGRPNLHGAGFAINDSSDKCPGGDLNFGTDQCVPFHAKVIHARVAKHVAKPLTNF